MKLEMKHKHPSNVKMYVAFNKFTFADKSCG
jgi:hypothetical protein